MLIRAFRPALTLLLLMTALLGVAYPGAITVIARLGFPDAASGSLLRRDGAVVGSRLIGQAFSSPAYFWGRPSATTPYPYNALASNGSNLGPLNPALLAQVDAAGSALRDADPDNKLAIPVDLVTASASGLDPEITPAGAQYQVRRIARARGVDVAKIVALVAAHERGPLLGFIGERRVNVLELNLALDELR